MHKITVVDYGFGNQFSIEQAFKMLGFQVLTTDNHKKVSNSDCIVLPGVGAFKKAMDELKRLKLDEALQYASKNKTPILGICLGMQLLFDESEEFGISKGLKLIPGKVQKLPNISKRNHELKLPNIGWNKLLLNSNFINSSKVSYIHEIKDKSFYFVHSYGVFPKDEKIILSYFDFGGYLIPSIVKSSNLTGMQFHPEKSADNGIKLLKSYLSNLF